MTLVAIDVAKAWNTVLVENPDGKRQRFRVANTRPDHDRLMLYLKNQRGRCQVAMEPTGNYHRPLAYRLLSEGFEVHLVSSVTAARFREAMFNSWDKNDPKDAAVILDLLKQDKVLRYYDPLVEGIHDLQEISKTYIQVTLARTRLQLEYLNPLSSSLLAGVRALLAFFTSRLVRLLPNPLPCSTGGPSTGLRVLHPRSLATDRA